MVAYLPVCVDVNESTTVPIPQVYLALQFRPIDFLAIEAEGRGISISGNKAYSLIGRLRFHLVGLLFPPAATGCNHIFFKLL